MEFWLYCAKDAAVTFECWPKIEAEMTRKGTRAQYDQTISLFDVLLYMQMRGIKADKDLLAKTKEDVTKRIDTLQAELNKRVGGELNVNSPKQCQEYFYIKRGFKPYANRKTGNITTDDKAMSRLEKKGVREAGIVREIRGLI